MTIFCDYCREDIGPRTRYPGEIETCGAPDCDRWARDQDRAAIEEAMYQAQQDDYARYR